MFGLYMFDWASKSITTMLRRWSSIIFKENLININAIVDDVLMAFTATAHNKARMTLFHATNVRISSYKPHGNQGQ